MSFGDGKKQSWLAKIGGGIGDDLRRAWEAKQTGGVYERLGGSRSGGRGRPAQETLIGAFASHSDPYPCLIGWRAGAGPEPNAAQVGDVHRHRMIMGTTGRTGEFVWTNERRNLLILGPPRSDKTAGVLIPLILSSIGPVVSTSTKDDVLRATGLARARLGTVWHFGPDGTSAPGCRPLRWSPIGPSKNWSRAIAIGKAIVETAEGGGSGAANSENAKFWSDRSSVFISSLLHAAALGNKPMQWLVRAVNGNERTLDEALDILNDSFDVAASIAADSLEGIVHLQDERTKANILATSATALSVYRLPGALATTENPNFDPAEFVKGRPHEENPHRGEFLTANSPEALCARMKQYRQGGFYDTIYVTASGSQQSLVAPLVAGLLTEIREAAYAQHRKDEAAGEYERPPVVWALDELASLPMADLPETLTQCAGQNLLVAACVQDLGLLAGKWKDAAETFLTLFGELVIHPGIRHTNTLEAISKIAGKEWKVVSSSTTQVGRSYGREKGRTESDTTQASQQLVDVLPVSGISNGPGDHPDRVLHLRSEVTAQGRKWDWSFCQPYYRTRPWSQLLVGTINYAGHQSGLEGQWEIPCPELDRAHDGQMLLKAGGPGLQLAHQSALSNLQRYRNRRREILPRLQAHPLLSRWGDTDRIERFARPEDAWLLSPDVADRGRIEEVIQGAGWSREDVKVEWFKRNDGTIQDVIADWVFTFDETAVFLRWQDPEQREAPNNAGWYWTDNSFLGRYTNRRGQPGLLLQGIVLDTVGLSVMAAFLGRLAELMPTVLLVAGKRPVFGGDWAPYGGEHRTETLFIDEGMELGAA